MRAETKAIDDVKAARRVAARAVERIQAGQLDAREVDFAGLLFGQGPAEERLARLGLLDDGGLCDALVARVRHWLLSDFEELGCVDVLAKHLKERIVAIREERSEGGAAALGNGLEKRVAAPGREDVAQRNAERSLAATAKVLAVHLCQRALYEGVSLALSDLVRHQSSGHAPEDRSHGAIAMGPKHVAMADGVIERIRKEHMAGVPERGPVTADVILGGRGGFSAELDESLLAAE